MGKPSANQGNKGTVKGKPPLRPVRLWTWLDTWVTLWAFALLILLMVGGRT